ncbi:hypothetical protein AAFF_G00375840, partial [Aldrovandia affinis]
QQSYLATGSSSATPVHSVQKRKTQESDLPSGSAASSRHLILAKRPRSDNRILPPSGR